MPIAGLAIGAGTGALAGKLADVGIDDDTIKQIGQQLQQGKAAVFVLARSATVDRVIEAIKPFNPTVIQTSLSHDREEEPTHATTAAAGVRWPAPGRWPRLASGQGRR
jgi:uncharacterized membrane protein